MTMRGTLSEGERWLYDRKIVVRCLKAAFRKILTVLTGNNEDFFSKHMVQWSVQNAIAHMCTPSSFKVHNLKLKAVWCTKCTKISTQR